jgi:hypothetical protein
MSEAALGPFAKRCHFHIAVIAHFEFREAACWWNGAAASNRGDIR